MSELKSGVHATLTGVALAFFIPLRARGPESHSPLRRLEHDLHAPVAFAILPLFAFANAGVPLGGVGIGAFLEPVLVRRRLAFEGAGSEYVVQTRLGGLFGSLASAVPSWGWISYPLDQITGD